MRQQRADLANIKPFFPNACRHKGVELPGAEIGEHLLLFPLGNAAGSFLYSFALPDKHSAMHGVDEAVCMLRNRRIMVTIRGNCLFLFHGSWSTKHDFVSNEIALAEIIQKQNHFNVKACDTRFQAQFHSNHTDEYTNPINQGWNSTTGLICKPIGNFASVRLCNIV